MNETKFINCIHASFYVLNLVLEKVKIFLKIIEKWNKSLKNFD